LRAQPALGNPCDRWFDFQGAGAPAFLWLRLRRAGDSVTFHPTDSRRALSGSADGILRLWRLPD
jgi:hypothetical protein